MGYSRAWGITLGAFFQVLSSVSKAISHNNIINEVILYFIFEKDTDKKNYMIDINQFI